jgi:hypothetical protein
MSCTGWKPEEARTDRHGEVVVPHELGQKPVSLMVRSLGKRSRTNAVITSMTATEFRIRFRSAGWLRRRAVRFAWSAEV